MAVIHPINRFPPFSLTFKHNKWFISVGEGFFFAFSFLFTNLRIIFCYSFALVLSHEIIILIWRIHIFCLDKFKYFKILVACCCHCLFLSFIIWASFSLYTMFVFVWCLILMKTNCEDQIHMTFQRAKLMCASKHEMIHINVFYKMEGHVKYFC